MTSLQEARDLHVSWKRYVEQRRNVIHPHGTKKVLAAGIGVLSSAPVQAIAAAGHTVLRVLHIIK